MMNIKKIELAGTDLESLRTELLYLLASSKVSGFEIVELVLYENNLKSMNNLKKLLKEKKKEGKIQLFVSEEDFKNETTEVVYLLNKYPNIVTDIKVGGFIVKL